MENPFIFDRVVTGEHFCNRRQEMEWLRERAGKANILVTSPRRYGKTSLIFNVKETYRLPFLYVDVAGISSREEFAGRLLRAIAKDYGRGSAILDRLLSMVDMKVSLSFHPLTITVERVDMKDLEKLLAFPKAIWVFDEFQEILNLHSFPWELRNVMQRVGRYIFSGSRRRVILELFSSPKRPFYKMADVLVLDKISYDDWKAFIVGWFKRGGLPISEEEVKALYTTSEGIPFYVQYLAHYLWEGKREGKNFQEVLEEVLESNTYLYRYIFDSLPPSQRKALLLLVEGGEGLFSRNRYSRYFKTPQQLQRALYLLEKKELVEKNGTYHLLDPLFKLWLKRYANYT